MKPPIIIDDHGDISVFESVERAERYLEPDDAETDPINIFDADGRLLVQRVIKKRRPWLGHVRVVELQSSEGEPQHQRQLRNTLIKFLSFLEEEPEESYDSWSLSELIQKGLEYKIE